MIWERMDSIEQYPVLDHIKDIRITGNVFSNPSNEYWALVCLKQGLNFLYHQVSRIDKMTKEKLNPDGNLKIFGYGNFPGTEDVPRELLTCSFHWYAISACQYVRTVGAIAYINDNTRPLPPDYVKEVIPEVLSFRDKVAAHFAWTSKHSADNDAERLASIAPPLSFVNDSWHVGALEISRTKKGKSSSSKSIMPWSINIVHLKLSQRYWPELIKQKT
jgi:hypothetical protein